MKGVVEHLLNVLMGISFHFRPYTCFPWLLMSPQKIHFFCVLIALVSEGSVAEVVFWKHHMCFQMPQFGMEGFSEQGFPHAGLLMVAKLAASKSPTLFIEAICSLALSIEILIH